MKKNVLTIDQFLNEQLTGPRIHLVDLRKKHTELNKDFDDLLQTIKFNITDRMKEHRQKTGYSCLRSKTDSLETNGYLKAPVVGNFYLTFFVDTLDDMPKQENLGVYDIEISSTDEITFYCSGIDDEIETVTWIDYDFPDEISQMLDVLEVIEKYTTVE